MSKFQLRIVGIVLLFPIALQGLLPLGAYVWSSLNPPSLGPNQVIVSHEIHFEPIWPIFLPVAGLGILGAYLIVASFRSPK